MDQRSGRMIQLSSTSALEDRGLANDAAAKARPNDGQRMGKTGNGVASGFIVKEMTYAMARRLEVNVKQFADHLTSAISAGHIGKPEDVAIQCCFLLWRQLLTLISKYFCGGRQRIHMGIFKNDRRKGRGSL
ncbi:hypothetical protein [Marinithermofilum abyssi]|uniref:hypothetical protein n=1 Tax=Marinithermofilum abyssi TaxID=1571185 RepID=UPI00166EE81B|nr:hypothetical protein [Marinithermofilum abyssi]